MNLRAKRVAIKTELIKRLGGSCSDCGLTLSKEWPVDCFDFHHFKGRKGEDLVSVLLRSSRSVETIFKKMAGCMVLCSNCHRRKTAKELEERRKSYVCSGS